MTDKETTLPPSMLDHALALAGQGFAVFPANPSNKKSLIKAWQENATKDPDQIRQWWTRWPRALIGAPTGWGCDLWVLDLDAKVDEATGEVTEVADLIAIVEAAIGEPLPQTLATATPRGGRHFFYRMPSDGREVRNRNPLMENIDVRGEGGYVILPPSKRAGGTTSFTNVDAAGAQRFLGMAGMSVSDILSSMPSVLNLSKAGRTDLAGTADIASNIMSGYGMTGKDMGRISDVLVGTFTRSNVNVKQIGETLKYVGPKAKAAGLELEYVAAATGKLGDAGIQGSMAGTALRTVISRLAGPPKMAKKALARLGVETKDLNGNLRSFEELLDEIVDKMKDLGSAEQIELTKKIAGEEGSSAFTVLLEQREHIKKLRDELKAAKGEAKEMASIMGDNAAGDEKVLGVGMVGAQDGNRHSAFS